MSDSAVSFHWPAPPEAALFFENIILQNPKIDSHLYDPSLLPSAAPSDRKYITSFDPATGMHLRTYVADTEADITNKIQIAAEAQRQWRHSTFTERRRVINSLKRWLVENQDVCMRVVSRDTGKSLLDAVFGDILTVCAKLDWLSTHGTSVLRPEKRHSNMLLWYKNSEVHFDPLGVVAALVSWNYPLHNSWCAILPALFAGNAVVLKCSEHVVWSSIWLVGAIKECLRACGLDPELVQLTYCLPAQAEALTRSPLIKHITFIGSEEVGRKVAAAAAENLTPVTLELGGKDAAIVLPGTDLGRWSSLWMRAIFQNTGQTCVGLERLLVHASQYDELYDIICGRARQLRMGPGLVPSVSGSVSTADCGSMISSERFGDLERIIGDAEREGATVAVGGRRYTHPEFDSGAFFSATVIGNPPPSSEAVQKELFGPIALLQSYETVEEAILLANGTRYGLGASVFGPDETYCLEVAKKLECGMVSVNDFGVFYLNQDLPFGGMKSSGYGRFAGPEGLRSLTNTKAIVVDRFPWLFQSSVHETMDYPIQSMVRGLEFASALIGVIYGDGWRAKGRWLMKMVNASRSNTTPQPKY